MLKNNVEYLADKVRGAMFGFAIGDAMGATTEFMSADAIKKKYGTLDDIVGGGWLQLDPGQVTDDTEMMLCVAEAYEADVGNCIRFADGVAIRFVRWYQAGPVDCGGACARGIQRIIDGKQPKHDASALGNGALMRALPMALVDHIGLNLIQGDLTHLNVTQHNMISEYHNMIIRQVYGNNYGLPVAWRINKRYGKYPDIAEPTGHVVNTLWNVVDCVKNTDNFRDAIVTAVNRGGDADTIAALVGGLAGAKYGWQNVPTEWVDKLDSGVKSRLERS